LALAYKALKAGGTSTTILNAANEVAVDAFLQKKIGFTEIAKIIEQVLDTLPANDAVSLDIVLQDDQAARELAHKLVAA
jgi:1-deoxy-D-xylulose-5-phosphate reductoisomerase